MRELVVVEGAADDLPVPRLGRADVLERDPVRQVGEEVGQHLVGDGVRPSMLRAAVGPAAAAASSCSMRMTRPWAALSYSAMSPAAKSPGSGRSGGRRQHAAEGAELEAGLAGEHDVGDGPDTGDHGVGGERAPGLGHDRAPDALAVALEAVDLVRGDDLDPVLSSRPRKKRPAGGPKWRSSGGPPASGSCTACRARSARRRPRSRCRSRRSGRRARPRPVSRRIASALASARR